MDPILRTDAEMSTDPNQMWFGAEPVNYLIVTKPI